MYLIIESHLRLFFFCLLSVFALACLVDVISDGLPQRGKNELKLKLRRPVKLKKCCTETETEHRLIVMQAVVIKNQRSPESICLIACSKLIAHSKLGSYKFSVCWALLLILCLFPFCPSLHPPTPSPPPARHSTRQSIAFFHLLPSPLSPDTNLPQVHFHRQR